MKTGGTDAELVNGRTAAMEPHPAVTFADTIFVRDTCLCLRAQRMARTLARRFDEAFRPFNLTNGQFSLLMALNQPKPPTIGEIAHILASDRTTLTAALKPLQRRELVETTPDPDDQRARRLRLTLAGMQVLGLALPVWRAEHAALQAHLEAMEASAPAAGACATPK